MGHSPPVDRRGNCRRLVYATTHKLPLTMTFNVQKMLFWYTNFRKSAYTPLPHPPLVLASPCLKIIATPPVVLYQRHRFRIANIAFLYKYGHYSSIKCCNFVLLKSAITKQLMDWILYKMVHISFNAWSPSLAPVTVIFFKSHLRNRFTIS